MPEELSSNSKYLISVQSSTQLFVSELLLLDSFEASSIEISSFESHKSRTGAKSETGMDPVVQAHDLHLNQTNHVWVEMNETGMDPVVQMHNLDHRPDRRMKTNSNHYLARLNIFEFW